MLLDAFITAGHRPLHSPITAVLLTGLFWEQMGSSQLTWGNPNTNMSVVLPANASFSNFSSVAGTKLLHKLSSIHLTVKKRGTRVRELVTIPEMLFWQ